MNKETLEFIQDSDEGRLDNLLEQDDNLDDFGIDPNDQNNIQVISQIEFSRYHADKWEKLKPIIFERCSTGTKDIGRFTGDEMTIELSSKIPVTKPIFRRSPAEMEELESKNKDFLDAGIISESTSPYNNPIMLIKKKNGKSRMVNDFRFLNLLMIAFIFPIMGASEIFDTLSGSTIFSTCDMTSGFW